MKKKQLVDNYLAKNPIPEMITKKINVNSYLTENFAYGAFRIGNSIGDLLDISIEVIILEEIAKKFNLIMDTTEHAELHSKGVTEDDLDRLVRGAILFENRKNNKKQYKEILKNITNFIREGAVKIISETEIYNIEVDEKEMPI